MEAVFSLVGLALALIGTIGYVRQLHQIAATAPQVSTGVLASPTPESDRSETEGLSLALIIPAYNEAANIQDCIVAALASCDWSADRYQVWVVDDQSTDDTLTMAQTLAAELTDPRLHLLAGAPRPAGAIWAGKNWACTQAAEKVESDYLLFLDADMRLKPGAIAAAMAWVDQKELDLLSCCPANLCGSLAEWLVQPLVFGTLAVGFPFQEVNDPASDMAFATGQFMLFRRSAYESIGGHRAVASQPVEDVQLAGRVKRSGLKLMYALGHDLASVRMYSSWAALWEGWTKNWHLGSNRNLSAMVQLVVLVLLVLTLPWVELGWWVSKALLTPLDALEWLCLVMAGVTVLFHYRLRQLVQQLSALSPRYWWLTGLGGLLMAAIAVASMVKTETGWGWTWRGRSLQLPITDDRPTVG